MLLIARTRLAHHSQPRERGRGGKEGKRERGYEGGEERGKGWGDELACRAQGARRGTHGIRVLACHALGRTTAIRVSMPLPRTASPLLAHHQ